MCIRALTWFLVLRSWFSCWHWHKAFLSASRAWTRCPFSRHFRENCCDKTSSSRWYDVSSSLHKTHTDFFVRTMTDKTSSEKKNQNNMWIPVLSVNVLQVRFSGAALWPTPLLHLPLQLQTVSVLDGFNCWEKNEVTQDFMRLIEGLLIKYQMQLVQVWRCYLTRADSSKYTQITDSSSCCWQDWWVSPHRLP